MLRRILAATLLLLATGPALAERDSPKDRSAVAQQTPKETDIARGAEAKEEPCSCGHQKAAKPDEKRRGLRWFEGNLYQGT